MKPLIISLLRLVGNYCLNKSQTMHIKLLEEDYNKFKGHPCVNNNNN